MHAYRPTLTAEPQVAKAIKELARKQANLLAQSRMESAFPELML